MISSRFFFEFTDPKSRVNITGCLSCLQNSSNETGVGDSLHLGSAISTCQIKDEHSNYEAFPQFEAGELIGKDTGNRGLRLFHKSKIIEYKNPIFLDHNCDKSYIVYDSLYTKNHREGVIGGFKINILAGGIRDSITFGLSYDFDWDEHNSASFQDGISRNVAFKYKSSTGIAEVNAKMEEEWYLPKTGSGESLEILLTSKNKVSP